jgi:hypothetical protein
MKAFLIFISALVALATPIAIIYFANNWKRLIWENSPRIFRIRSCGVNILSKDKSWWVVEKRFLCFFINCSGILNSSRFSSKDEAMGSLFQYLRELDKRQNPYIIDLRNQITDQNRLIESKTLETKRIDYDSN